MMGPGRCSEGYWLDLGLGESLGPRRALGSWLDSVRVTAASCSCSSGCGEGQATGWRR